MKNIKNITIDDINNIYSLIIGEPRTAGKVEWTEEKDFVIAVFKIEESSLPQYNTVEMGIQINEDLNVDHVWWYINDKGTGVVYQPLRNHNKITKYLIKEGFNV